MEGGAASPVWPPSGIGLAAILLLGSRVWPGILAGAFLANLHDQFDMARYGYSTFLKTIHKTAPVKIDLTSLPGPKDSLEYRPFESEA